MNQKWMIKTLLRRYYGATKFLCNLKGFSEDGNTQMYNNAENIKVTHSGIDMNNQASRTVSQQQLPLSECDQHLFRHRIMQILVHPLEQLPSEGKFQEKPQINIFTYEFTEKT